MRRVEMVLGMPAGPVRGLVDSYHGYREWGDEPGTHRGLPSPYLTVIITLEEPLQVAAHPDPRQKAGRYDTLVGGLHTSPALITHQGRQAGVQLGLSPLGARALLGVPAGELANVDVDAGELLGVAAARELHERLNAAAGWGERFRVLDELLARRLDRSREVPPEVVRAWTMLLRGGGTVPVAELAREVGWSARHLGARFGAEIGLAPKVAGRVIRFDRARRALQARAAAAAGPAGGSTGGGRRRDPGGGERNGWDGEERSRRASGQGSRWGDGEQSLPASGRGSRWGGGEPGRRDSGEEGRWGGGERGRWGGEGVVLADLAVEMGFYDQSHLVREFREFSGCSPTRWLAEEFRNVQAAGAPSRAQSGV
ncbi:DUF6597 domain-containing transcriptional factor [Sphaerisporangium sp. B11E5]|uniref:DUF6597 domain-containing transcriptional factor n=1 Tax=Sphaerisporangium sp. B11E5 TaxID=3153563 RepID=UPI00325EA821